MLGDTKQLTTGDQSPVIHGDRNSVTYETKKKLNNEVRTMLVVVHYIPEVARQKRVTSEYTEPSKDIQRKINVRFAEHKEELKNRLLELTMLYKSSYEEALRNEEVDEFSWEEMCSLLRSISLKVLEEENENPVTALQKLTSLFEDQFSLGNDLDFSRQAIEYFLYRQLIECNVFPNPIE